MKEDGGEGRGGGEERGQGGEEGKLEREEGLWRGEVEKRENVNNAMGKKWRMQRTSF